VLKERFFLQLKVKTPKRKKLSTGELLRIVNNIKERYEIYKKPRNHRYREHKKEIYRHEKTERHFV
jgi:hypothetical protein